MTIGIPDLGTTGQQVLQHLRLAIVAGDYHPGQRVPQEEIAERFGVSVAPVREALQALQQEGQVTYQPRRGYFITELAVEDLREIYDLRQLLEEHALRLALPTLDTAAIDTIAEAAAECAEAADRGDVAKELAANRRFHFRMLDAPGQTHTMRLIRLLWDCTESYRAMYYNSPVERERTVDAHERILVAIRRGDEDAVIAELDDHRDRALQVLTQLLRA